MAEKCLELKDIRKSFSKDEVVLKEISLSIDKGEFITLLGSSGCGKTTTLRIIAGLETPDSGKVYLEGKDVTALAPEARDVNTVFQNYALFPHMTVADNIGYGLKLKQRQRVAIARSLVNNPKVLLLDEPLGALDLQLRRAMQLELKRLQKKLGITFIYITHDQEEAINMSDRIAVMNKGTFEQIGTPDEIYNHPKTSYVATFVGNANILKGTAQETEADILKVSLAGSIVSAVAEGKKIAPGTPVTLAVRSENMIFDETCQSGMEAVVVEKSFAGGLLRVALKLADGTEVIANRHGIDAGVQPGQKVTCHFDAENAVLVDLSSEEESGAEV